MSALLSFSSFGQKEHVLTRMFPTDQASCQLSVVVNNVKQDVLVSWRIPTATLEPVPPPLLLEKTVMNFHPRFRLTHSHTVFTIRFFCRLFRPSIIYLCFVFGLQFPIVFGEHALRDSADFGTLIFSPVLRRAVGGGRF